ncbi:presequence protease, mitochondrial isoform X2 [Parasteatoda tepidariorum]|uniref:presequence protease, mitochondrial isoform X2 n=2 Tax=Parasteatoda tepidariorum TaxID=114398 RepID=UPI00077FA572|nr:presequence protease, mitochondrial isoform X2 [Parasteatoda tepidariorum]
MFGSRLARRYAFDAYKRYKNFTQCLNYSSISTKFKPDNSILGYSVKKVEEISELNLTAILLEHKSTGAEHLHLACDDSNNVFSVSFRTPVSNSSGVPHILEHLALCGSLKYPCRDPFFNLLNRSLSTFMNAMTGDDSTMYVFSTQNVKDFGNLLSVYLDAAFFPLLNEMDFRQEGWRLEHENIHDRSSPIILKGVVFNEMKGVYSDPNAYYYYNLKKRLFPSNNYTHISGGDPLCIPTLSWEALKQFHSHHYHPSNSRFITYGNMSLEHHLEAIEASVLRYFKKLEVNNKVPDVVPWTEPKEAHIFNKFDPLVAIPEKQHMISQSFLLNKITNTYESFALSILANLLTDGPSAPFYQNLIETGIGPDFSPATGYMSHFKQSVFSVGVREIAEGDVDRVKDVIASTFDEVIKTGFPEKRIKGVLHSVEIGTKHRTARFGLSCAMSVNSLWNHDGCPVTGFKVNDHVQWFLRQMNENPHFLQDKIVQYFKNNAHKLTLVMSPKENFEAELKEEEKKLLESKLNVLSEEDKLQIYEKGLDLSKHQTKSDASCLPSLEIKDVKEKLEKTPLKFSMLDGTLVQTCEQPTNEVVYFRAVLDANRLSEEDLMLLPLMCSVITQMGAGKRNYKEFDQEIQLKTGNFSTSLNLFQDPLTGNDFDQEILLSSYCLEKNMPDMFALWKDIFNEVHLEDGDRFTQLVRLIASDMAQGVSHSGHAYAMRKASSYLSPVAAVREKTSGLAQLIFLKNLAEASNHDEILQKIRKLADNLFHQKVKRFALNATPNAMPSAFDQLSSFNKEIRQSNEISKNYSPMDIKKVRNQRSHFVLPLSVNFIAQSILTASLNHEHFGSLKVAAKLLSSKYLHSEIREKGGAYGGGAKLNTEGHFKFYSYRDPNVDKTLNSFSAGIDWLIDGSYSAQDINEAKLGVFSEIDAPVAPGSKGMSLFLSKIDHEMREALRQQIFKCDKNSIVEATKRYLKNSEDIGTVLIGPEIENSQSKWSKI